MENNSEQTDNARGQDNPGRRRNSSLLSKGLSLSALTLGSRVLGLVREMTKARFLGTSAYSDAFGIAFMIPNLFRRLFAENAISVAFIPTFKGYLEEDSSEQGTITTQRFVSSTFTLVTFLTAVFVTLGIILAPWILRIFYGTDSIDAMREAVLLTRIMFPYLMLISIAAFFQGILNGLKIFSPSGFTPILFNAIVIAATYILSPRTQNPARAMAIGVIAGGAVQALFQLPFVLKNKWKVTLTSLRSAFTNPGTRKVIALVGPTIIGMAGYQLNDVVSSALATRAGEGVVSSLQYSLRLQELILGICAVTIGTVILPDLTGFAKKSEWDSFNSMLTQSIKIMALIALPITFYSLVMGENLITLIFAGGKFDSNSIRMTMQVFRYHIAGLFFIAVNRITAPAFYAQQDTKSPMLAGLVNFAVNILLAFILTRSMGGAGIALALTVASMMNTVMLFVFLRRTPNINVNSVIKSSMLYALRIILYSVIAALPVYLMRDRLLSIFAGRGRFFSQGIPVLISALVFGGIGAVLLLVTKDPLVEIVRSKLRRKRIKGEAE